MSVFGVKLDPRVSLGNIITAAACACSLVYATAYREAESRQQALTVAAHENRLEHVEKRVSDLELTTSRSAETFEWIKRSLERIQDALQLKR
jgi:hypothetical protein